MMDQQQPAQIQDQNNPNAPILIKQYSGLQNTIDPERMGTDDLVYGQNIDLDDSKQAHRRRGYTLKASGSWHSLYLAANGNVYGARNGDLVRIFPDYTYLTVRAGVGQERICYEDVGHTLYWSNREYNGKVDTQTDTASPWGALDGNGQWWSPVIQPRDTLGPIAGKLLRNPPVAEFIGFNNGRIYMAKDRVIWATELWQYDYVDATKTYIMFEADITGLGMMSNGFYVGTNAGMYYIDGTLNKFNRVMVTPEPVLKGSMVNDLAEAHVTRPLRRGSRSAISFMTTGGFCVGFDNGIYQNLTQDRFWFPPGNVSALRRKQDGIQQYIGVVDSGGSPASSARIGDYIDAEIRRFSGV